MKSEEKIKENILEKSRRFDDYMKSLSQVVNELKESNKELVEKMDKLVERVEKLENRKNAGMVPLPHPLGLY